MNEALQAQLVEFVQLMLAAVETGVDQIPPLVTEKVLYGRITHTIGCVLGVLLVAQSAWSGRKCYEADKRNSEAAGAWFVAAGGGLVLGSIMVVGNWSAAIQAWLTPRLYVVEWLRGFL